MERKLIAVAVSSALALPMAAQAVEFAASGHINRAIISVDGGANDGDLQHVDANSSQTRFRFTGSGELDSGMTAGVQLEYGLTANVRHANVYLTSAGGKLTVGHGSRATDGMAHADLGGPAWLGGASNWCNYASTGPACPSNDGGRGPMLRYDTPAIGPASIAVSAGNDDYWDVMLKISGSMGDAGYDLRIGHIGEYDSTMDVARVEAVPGIPGMPATAATTASESVMGSALLAKLQEEMPFDQAAETADSDANPLFESDGTPSTTITNDNAATSVDAHVTGADDVLALYQADAESNLEDSTYRKVTHVPGTDGTDGTAGTAAVAATTAPTTAGDVTTASAAFSFGQGTSVALAWSQDNRVDHEYQYIKLDHSYGDGSIAVYYKRGENADGTEGSLVGIGLGHNLGNGATAYAGYRQMSEDNKDDVDLLVAGLRVTFN